MKYYITTPIYYVNDKPHIGHAYTSIIADVLARSLRESGETFFLTGTDEHGQKIEKSAIAKGIETQAFCDEVSKSFKDLTPDFNLTNNDFIRTTEERHKTGVALFWKKLEENGWIYKGFYKGWYAIRDEAFYSEDELIDGKAPTGAEVIWQEEESYFFKLSVFSQVLTWIYKSVPFVFPESRLNEVKSFVASGLKDLSISRNSFKWGIKVPSSENHVIYVWLDALTNYITALGYGSPDQTLYEKFWLSENSLKIHIIGKDILRFHAIFWPAFLIAERYTLSEIENCFTSQSNSLQRQSGSPITHAFTASTEATPASGLRPPYNPNLATELTNFFSNFKIVSHGWWKNGGEKMSKSLGNAINPYDLKEKYGLDRLRYFFLREVPFGGDGDFSHERFISITNADLSNNIGNLTQRVMSFIYANCDGKIPEFSGKNSIFPEHVNSIESLNKYLAEMKQKYRQSIKEFKFSEAIEVILVVSSLANEMIDKSAPWALKKAGETEKMNDCLYLLSVMILEIYKMLSPIMPYSAMKGLKIFDGENLCKDDEEDLPKLCKLEVISRKSINKPEPIFIRL